MQLLLIFVLFLAASIFLILRVTRPFFTREKGCTKGCGCAADAPAKQAMGPAKSFE